MPMSEDVLIPLAGIGLPAVLVPMILTFRHVAKKREYQHAERMKALETGRPVPGESHWPQAFVCAAVGAGVPMASFLFTLIASTSRPFHTPNEIWVAPTVVSCIAVLSTMGLAKTLFRSAKTSQVDAHLNGKPAFDPDAYDVVGTRG